jgi:hypothetical protein
MARAKPGSWASPVNGDEVRGTWFFRRESLWGYDASGGRWLARPRRVGAGRRSASGPVGRERGAGRAMTSTPSTCSWASSFLTLGLGATSATWPSSAGTRPLTSPTAPPVWRGEGAGRMPPGGGLFRRRMLELVARLRPPTGMRLWAERAGRRRELRTAEQQTLASLRGFTWQNRGYGQALAVSAARRSFTSREGAPDEEPAVSRPHKGHRLEPGGSGPGAARPAESAAAGASGARCSSRAGGHGEGLRRTRGEAARTQPGSSSAERTSDAGIALARTELRLR